MNDIAQTPLGAQLAYELVKREWPHLVERFSLNDRVFGRLIYYVTRKFFNTQAKLDDVSLISDYLTKKDLKRLSGDRNNGVEFLARDQLQKSLKIQQLCFP